MCAPPAHNHIFVFVNLQISDETCLLFSPDQARSDRTSLWKSIHFAFHTRFDFKRRLCEFAKSLKLLDGRSFLCFSRSPPKPCIFIYVQTTDWLTDRVPSAKPLWPCSQFRDNPQFRVNLGKGSGGLRPLPHPCMCMRLLVRFPLLGISYFLNHVACPWEPL